MDFEALWIFLLVCVHIKIQKTFFDTIKENKAFVELNT